MILLTASFLIVSQLLPPSTVVDNTIGPSNLDQKAFVALAQPLGERKVHRASSGSKGPKTVSVSDSFHVIESSDAKLVGELKTLSPLVLDQPAFTLRPPSAKFLILGKRKEVKAPLPTEDTTSYELLALVPVETARLNEGSTVTEQWLRSLAMSAASSKKHLARSSLVTLHYQLSSWNTLESSPGQSSAFGKLLKDRILPELEKRAMLVPPESRLPFFCISSSLQDIKAARSVVAAVRAKVERNIELTNEDFEWLSIAKLWGRSVTPDELIELSDLTDQVKLQHYLILRTNGLPLKEKNFRTLTSFLEDEQLRSDLLQGLAMLTNRPDLHPLPRLHGEAEPPQWKKLVAQWKSTSLAQAIRMRDRKK